VARRNWLQRRPGSRGDLTCWFVEESGEIRGGEERGEVG
jgi:hypothetical protein